MTIIGLHNEKILVYVGAKRMSSEKGIYTTINGIIRFYLALIHINSIEYQLYIIHNVAPQIA
ncbi:hypothetical protein Plhal304r1_c008g0030651 [Plasmopara halstedii]